MSINGMKTYQLSLLQAKVNRRVRAFLAKFLVEYDLKVMEWTLLGYVSENSNGGIKISDIASAFDVEISLMTNTLNQLAAKKLVKRTPHPADQRIRLIQITRQGSLLVNEIEHVLAERMASWLKDLDQTALITYVEVLEYLAHSDS